MKAFKHLFLGVLAAAAASTAYAQDMTALNGQWRQTVNAIQRGDQAEANADFATFNATARFYASLHGRNWQIEYLIGSLDCMFPGTHQIGAEFLSDILQNNRILNGEGDAELRRQLTACKSQTQRTVTAAQLTVPQNLTEASTHYQAPGVHGDMKSGGNIVADQEAAAAVSPMAAVELLNRRVSIDNPQKALQDALARMPAGASGAIEGVFVVATATGTAAEAEAIGRCLQRYSVPLMSEFQISSPSSMVTAYAVSSDDQVYSFSRRLHGLNLPLGVIAYSVPEDMSLVSPATGASCGSMAHELVHLLIKQNFPGAPAWLEEGLASEVAIAERAGNRFQFRWSWRDEDLQSNLGLQPSIAELLDMPWSGFSPSDMASVSRAEATQAMAAVFIRYLDAKGKLSDVYFSVRDQHVDADFSSYRSYQSILEEKLGMPVASMNTDFIEWFHAQAGPHSPAPLTPSSDPSTYCPPNRSVNSAPCPYRRAPQVDNPAKPY